MPDVKQVIVVRKDLSMKKGQLAACVAHASMKFLTDNNEAERYDEFVVKLSPAEAQWLSGSYKKIVVGVNSAEALENVIFQAQLEGIEVHPIIDDNGFHDSMHTVTCVALGPCESSVLDKITGNLATI